VSGKDCKDKKCLAINLCKIQDQVNKSLKPVRNRKGEVVNYVSTDDLPF